MNEYYTYLERQQRSSVDVTEWLKWFLNCLGQAIQVSEQTLSTVIYKASLWQELSDIGLNSRQKLIINMMLETNFKGYMNTSKYATLCKCSNDSALRDIQHLVKVGILVKNPSGGRSTSYRIREKIVI